MAEKRRTSITISDEASALRSALARKLGISLGAVIEMAIRRLADAESVKAEPPKTTTKRPRK